MKKSVNDRKINGTFMIKLHVFSSIFVR